LSDEDITVTTDIIQWLDSLHKFLSLHKNKQGIPLVYPLCDHDEPTGEEDEEWNDDHERLIHTTSFDGDQFKEDNAILYTLIRQCSKEGSPAFPMVKKERKTRDGRSVFKALKAYYQGSGASSVTVHKANHELKSLRYTGDKPRFTFDTFLARLLNAYEVIERETGLTYPDPIKVETLLDKIEVSLIDIKVAKSTVSSSESMKNDFASAYNFLSVEIGRHKSKIKSERSIAASSSGRSRGDKNDKPSRILSQMIPLSATDSFTDDEWWNVLQQEHRDEMQRLRKARKQKKRRTARAANRKRGNKKITNDACDQFATQAKAENENKRTKTEA